MIQDKLLRERSSTQSALSWFKVDGMLPWKKEVVVHVKVLQGNVEKESCSLSRCEVE